MPEDDAVERQLRAYAEAAEAAVPEVVPVAPARRRRGRVLLAVAAVLAIVAGVAGVVALQDDEDAQPVISGVDEPVVPEGGRWDELPPPPIAGRIGHAMVATDDELIVWGGRNDEPLADGAAWSFAEQRWRALAPSPLSPRADALAVWTGREVFVWGGVDAAGKARDGAAYDPAEDRWIELPDAPFDAVAGGSGAAWTGTRFAVTGVEGKANEFLPSDTYALDPEAGAWSALPPMPDSLGSGGGAATWWEGDSLVVVSLPADGPVVIERLDPDRDAWWPTATTEVEGSDVDPARVAFGGGRIAIVANADAGAVYDLATGRLTPIPAAATGWSFPARYVGDRLTVGDRFLDVDGTWRAAAPTPDRTARERPGAVVFDGAYVVWGGDGCGPGADCNGFVEPSPAGLIWTPPPVGSGPSTSVPSGHAVIEIEGELACGPEDAAGVEVTVTSPGVAREVRVELVVYTDTDTDRVDVGGSELFHLPRDDEVSEFVPFRRDRLELLGDSPSVGAVAHDAAGGTLGGAIVPLRHEAPSCG